MGTISVVFRIEEEFLCKAKSCREGVVVGGYVFFAFQLTIHIY